MAITVDIPVISDIPPIHVGATWHSFDLSFFLDEAKTIPCLVGALPLRSQICHRATGRRVALTILPGASLNEILFRLTREVTKTLMPGAYDWDVFVEDSQGNRDPLAAGVVTVYGRATIWS